MNERDPPQWFKDLCCERREKLAREALEKPPTPGCRVFYKLQDGPVLKMVGMESGKHIALMIYSLQFVMEQVA